MSYDCGVLLSEDGQFGRPDYRDHNSPLSLHSFYLIEWATFGVLCMALLANPEAKRKIHGGCCAVFIVLDPLYEWFIVGASLSIVCCCWLFRVCYSVC